MSKPSIHLTSHFWGDDSHCRQCRVYFMHRASFTMPHLQTHGWKRLLTCTCTQWHTHEQGHASSHTWAGTCVQLHTSRYCAYMQSHPHRHMQAATREQKHAHPNLARTESCISACCQMPRLAGRRWMTVTAAVGIHGSYNLCHEGRRREPLGIVGIKCCGRFIVIEMSGWCVGFCFDQLRPAQPLRPDG